MSMFPRALRATGDKLDADKVVVPCTVSEDPSEPVVVVPIPVLPPLVTKNAVPVEDPIANAGAVPSVLLGFMESSAHGEVEPTATLPLLSTKKLVPVDDPIAKAGAVPFVEVGLMESWAQGVVVPTPTKPRALS